jgi:hypothetical protein
MPETTRACATENNTNGTMGTAAAAKSASSIHSACSPLYGRSKKSHRYSERRWHGRLLDVTAAHNVARDFSQ